MTRIPELMDLSELGSLAAMQGALWTSQADAGPATDQRFRDAKNNGGNYSLRLFNGGGADAFMDCPPLATPAETFFVRFHHRRSSFEPTSLRLITWYSAGYGEELGSLRVTTAGRLELYSGGTLLATSTNAILLNVWYTIELHVVIADSGSYEVRVNGTSANWIPAGTGDTKPGSAAAASLFRFIIFGGSFVPPSRTCWFDDIAGDYTTWCGEGVVTVLSPNADGTTLQLTPSSGTIHYNRVNEIPPSDATYNEATAPNQKDTYAHAALPATATTVRAAAVVARAVRVGEQIATLYPVIRSGGADYEGSPKTLGVNHAVFAQFWELDPDTEAPWTVADLNATEIGVRFDT